MPETRIAFADANWLFAAYYETTASKEVRRWAAQGPSTIVVSGPVLAECRCNFWRAGDRALTLDADLSSGRFVDCGYTFEHLSRMAEKLYRRFAPRCNAGTLDLLHIQAARQFGCRWFLSFDRASGCRAIATLLKLRVFPELDSEDRKIIALLR